MCINQSQLITLKTIQILIKKNIAIHFKILQYKIFPQYPALINEHVFRLFWLLFMLMCQLVLVYQKVSWFYIHNDL